MKLAVSSYSLIKWRNKESKTLENMIDWMVDAGIEAVEFSGIDPKEETSAALVDRANTLKQYCEKRGVAVVGYCIGAELLVPAKKQAEAVKRLQAHVDAAHALGVHTMRHDITRGDFKQLGTRYTGPTTFPAALKHIIPAIRTVADYAATKDVKTSLENHGFYCQAPNRVETLIKKVDHPNFGLTLDMGNFLCVNADPVAAVEQLLPLAQHVHVKDFHIKANKKQAPSTGWIITPTPIAIRGSIVGHGNIDIPAQLKLLKQAGYKGYLSLEFEGLEESRFGVLEGLKYLRERM